ncbi:centromere protein K isoform X2 [Nothobranchius furzeri]|uniref:centromere protein K isoform X2 n=1 Tax=Nothobranchius furzeri TaxID=105023 RepID=UPI0039048BB7
MNMGEVRSEGEAEARLSDAAQTELMDLCEKQFNRLEELQNVVLLSDSEFPPDQHALNRLIATEAEVKQWLLMESSSLPTNSEILRQAVKEEMLKLCSELEMVVSCCEARRNKLKETKELEQKWLEEKKQVLLVAKNHIERLTREQESLSGHSILLEIKEKIRKVKEYHEKLMECLGDILETHVPLPTYESTSSKRKKILMNKILTEAHDPYVLIDHTFWPPYVELLLRHGIAVRHQENKLKIRLEKFF